MTRALPPAAVPAEKVRARRVLFLGLVLAISAVLIWGGARAIAPDGWTTLRLAIFVCLVVNAPWLGLSAATGLIGFAVRLGSADPVATVLPQLALPMAGRPATLRTAIAVCVRDEDVGAVFGRLARLSIEIEEAGRAACYVLCVLSDTASDAVAGQEAAAADRLRAGGGPELLYRRRTANTGFKAGNVMSFLDAHDGAFALMLCLDADSAMTLPAIERMASVMQADPGLAILQATFHGHGAHAPFSRLFGFGHRHGLRVWATGQAWWQADQGPYWGHNALVRVAPFRAHCRLDPLPDGSLIMSHDHVEAARLQAAGWKVRVLASDEGSSECHPPSLPDYLVRDVRWAAGNMQYRHLLRRPDLGPLGRLQMLQAILHYVLTPFWFAMLPLAALNAALGGADVPRAPVLCLLVAGWLTLHGPKLLGYAEVLLRPALARQFGGATSFARSCLWEVGATVLLDPVIAAHKSWAVLGLALGRRVGWSGQVRDGHAIGWATGLRMFWPHSLAGLTILGLFGSVSAFACAACLPFVAGLVLAVPFAVLTSVPDAAGLDSGTLAVAAG